MVSKFHYNFDGFGNVFNPMAGDIYTKSPLTIKTILFLSLYVEQNLNRENSGKVIQISVVKLFYIIWFWKIYNT
jgi:hypothetical protein